MPSVRSVVVPSLLALVAAVASGCASADGGASGEPPAETTEDGWTQASKAACVLGLSFVRGHEDLTRFAVDDANALLRARAKEGAQPWTYPVVPVGEHACATKVPLVAGNFATDIAIESWPFKERPGADLLAFYGNTAKSLSEWQAAPELQSLHFLRDRVDGEPLSAKGACMASRAKIVAATKQALSEGTRERREFFFGHSLHIIEDSFSPAHVRRASRGTLGEESDFKAITDVCTYGEQVKGACFHEEPIFGGAIFDDDRIWKKRALFTTSRDRKYLVPEADAAAKAGAGYLVAVEEMRERMARGKRVNVEAELDRLFDEEVDPAGRPGSLFGFTGFFRCPE